MDTLENGQQSAQQPVQQTVIVQQEPQRKSNGIGTAGFVLSLVALFLCWIPVLDWILWLLGLIFSAIGEELGMLGCLAVLILLTAIIIRIIHVGIKSGNYMNRLICVGIAGMLTAQVFINIGVCIGLVPVIGLTLPFFSYGGSSLVTMFFAMGIVSGINMRPAPDSSARYTAALP